MDSVLLQLSPLCKYVLDLGSTLYFSVTFLESFSQRHIRLGFPVWNSVSIGPIIFVLTRGTLNLALLLITSPLIHGHDHFSLLVGLLAYLACLTLFCACLILPVRLSSQEGKAVSSLLFLSQHQHRPGH